MRLEILAVELIDIVRKLVGPIQPVGETSSDAARLENMKEVGELVEMLLCDLETAAMNKDRPEASMREIGQKADMYLREFKSA